MSKKFLYVDSAGDYVESAGAYEQSDFVAVSAGAGDAGKPVKLDGDGNIDASMINDADISHDSTGGVSASTAHAAFPLLVGGRSFTAIQSYDSHKTFTADTDIVDKKYVDDLNQGDEWKDSVLDRLITPPGSPSTGDRYLLDATLGSATGAWAGHDDEIAEWSGSAWTFSGAPSAGWKVSVDDETDGVYLYGGSSWTKKSYESTTASLGCQKVGVDIRANLQTSGGLKLNGDAIEVEPGDFAGNGLEDDGSDNLQVKADATGGANLAKVVSVTANGVAIKIDDSTIEENGSGQLGVKADGIKDTHIDWGTGANQVSGVDVPLADAGGYFDTDNVEAALQQIALELGDPKGVEYTAGTGGVAKGDLVYVSGADTINKLDINTANVAIGIAEAGASAGNPVMVLRNDIAITSVVTGATAGTKYYWTWNGSSGGWSTSMPTGTGLYVWLGGVAKNGTDVHVQVQFIKKNA